MGFGSFSVVKIKERKALFRQASYLRSQTRWRMARQRARKSYSPKINHRLRMSPVLAMNSKSLHWQRNVWRLRNTPFVISS
jgi:hypothetical protein